MACWLWTLLCWTAGKPQKSFPTQIYPQTGCSVHCTGLTIKTLWRHFPFQLAFLMLRVELIFRYDDDTSDTLWRQDCGITVLLIWRSSNIQQLTKTQEKYFSFTSKFIRNIRVGREMRDDYLTMTSTDLTAMIFLPGNRLGPSLPQLSCSWRFRCN